MTTLDELLNNHKRMDDFIHQLSHYRIANASGSAFRSHPIGYFENGILLISDHHTSRSCRIQIASVPETEIKLGCQESCAHGDPYPKPKEGEFVTVWRSGKWVKEGPWQEKIYELLKDLLSKISAFETKRALEEEHKQREARMKMREADLKIIEAWS